MLRVSGRNRPFKAIRGKGERDQRPSQFLGVWAGRQVVYAEKRREEASYCLVRVGEPVIRVGKLQVRV